MVRGTYTIYLDGEEVLRSDNIITNFGKIAILRYLAGNISNYAGAVSVGVSDKLTSPSDFTLDYELARVPITYKTITPPTSSIIFKSTFGSGLAGKIYEIGLFPSIENIISGLYQTATLFEFDIDETWQGIPLRDIENARIGTSSAQISAAAGLQAMIYVNDIRLDLSGYSSTDVFKLAFNTFDTNCSSITVKFVNNLGSEMTGTFTPVAHTASNGSPQYQIVTITKNSFSNLAADWSSIIRAEVSLTAGVGDSVVSIDGLKVVDADNLNPDYGMISRTTLSTPITKDANQTMDVEYSLVVPL